MVAQELRIGSKIGFYKPDLNEIQIGTIKDIKFEDGEYKFWIPEFSNNVRIGSSGIKPIPLTEDWLLKFGFTKNPFDDCIELVANGFTLINGDRCGYFDVFELDHDDLRVRYVHTLQNLYFAITGTELTLKIK